MEINQVQEIKIKNSLDILSTIKIKLTGGNDILTSNSILNDNQIETNADIVDNKKNSGRLFFLIGKKNKVITGKSITRTKFNITF
jgi:hypothetical protein